MIVIVSYIVSAVCLWLLLSAVAVNFFFSGRNPVRKEKKSVVETGSMLAFFVLTVLLVYLDIGMLPTGPGAAQGVSAAGALSIAAGTAVNLAGRFTLKSNWGNRIRIYEQHTLTTNGIYKHIRHPLYASTILMLYGFSLLFINAVVFALTSAVFVPFMIYRAKQEDGMLAETFGAAFTEYKEKTGMFLPKIFRKTKTQASKGEFK